MQIKQDAIWKTWHYQVLLRSLIAISTRLHPEAFFSVSSTVNAMIYWTFSGPLSEPSTRSPFISLTQNSCCAVKEITITGWSSIIFAAIISKSRMSSTLPSNLWPAVWEGLRVASRTRYAPSEHHLLKDGKSPVTNDSKISGTMYDRSKCKNSSNWKSGRLDRIDLITDAVSDSENIDETLSVKDENNSRPKCTKKLSLLSAEFLI